MNHQSCIITQHHQTSLISIQNHASSCLSKTYFTRCSDEARKCIGSNICDWSLRWIRATISWDDRMSRDWVWQRKFYEPYPQSRSVVCHPRSGFQMLHVKEFFCTSFSWAVALSRFKQASFVAAVRVVCETERSHSSRTNTRCVKGVVHPRYHDCIEWARSSMNSE